MQVENAQRVQLLLSMALIGASGSGKSRKALTIAYGLLKFKYPEISDEEIWQKVGAVDTEKRRLDYYVNRTFNDNAPINIGVFKKVNLTPPFTATRCKQAVDLLKKSGCEVVIFDSFSHSWFSTGGVLELQKDAGGTYQAWGSKSVTNALNVIYELIRNDVHMITTLRAKEDLRLVPDETGKLEVKKFGVKAVMREEIKFEYDVSLMLDSDHKYHIDKDNTDIFESRGNGGIITIEDGFALGQWLDEGLPIEEVNKQRLEQLSADVSDLLSNDEKAIQKYERYATAYEKKMKKELDLTTLDLAGLTAIYNYLIK